MKDEDGMVDQVSDQVVHICLCLAVEKLALACYFLSFSFCLFAACIHWEGKNKLESYSLSLSTN